MRALTAAALIFAALATPATAQNNTLDGTWAFQSQSYGTEQVGAVMSGVAVVDASAPNRYDIRIIANEMLVNRETGESVLLTARQTCTGEDADGQFTISCQMAEPLEGYAPDNFLLQPGETDQLVGVLNAGPQVTFVRMR